MRADLVGIREMHQMLKRREYFFSAASNKFLDEKYIFSDEEYIFSNEEYIFSDVE